MIELAKILVSGVDTRVVELEPIPEKITGATVRFVFDDPMWDGLIKNAVFVGAEMVSVLNVGEEVEIPAEAVDRHGKLLKVGICGTTADGKVIIPTLYANLGQIRPAADPSADPSADPTLPIWAQLQAEIEQLKETGLPGGGGGITNEKDPTVPEWAKQLEPPTYTAQDVGADPKGTAESKVSGHNTDTASHNDLRLDLKALSDRISAVLDSDDTTLDELSEIVAYIKSNKSLIEAVTTSKVSITDIIDNLVTNVANKPLSAAQGVALNGLIEEIRNLIPTDEHINSLIDAKLDSGGNVDLEGYATEQWVKDQKYLTAVPDGYAKIEDIPKKPEDIGAQPIGNYALKSEIPSVPVQSVNGKTGSVKLSASDVGARPDNWMPSAQEVGALPNTYTPPNQTAEQVGADPKGTAASVVSQHNVSDDSHGDIRLELKAINDRLTAFFDSDNQTLDELSEIVAYITSNKSLIDSVTTSKVSVADIVNNLTSNVSNKPLSAAQGVVLKGLVDAVSNSLANYQPKGNYLTEETDPTVPAWAKQSTKPSYSKSEVGLGNVDNVKQYSASNPPPYPVTSVNGKTGAVTINVPTVPTKVSAFTNDAGYLTKHQDISGKVDKTGLTLGRDESGLLYIWVDGAPVGNGMELPTGGIDGYITADKQIVFNNLPDGEYTLAYVKDDGTIVPIGALDKDTAVYYTVTNNLTRCTNSNSTSKIVQGSAYSATITADSGYELSSVKVTMGGSNVSVTNGVINIANVTGHIVITATATEKVVAPTYTNLFVPSTATLNQRMSGSSKAPKNENGYVMTAAIMLPVTFNVTGTSKEHFIAVPSSMWVNSANFFSGNSAGDTQGYNDVSGAGATVVGNWAKIPISNKWGNSYSCDRIVVSLYVKGSAITASDIQNIEIYFDEIPE